jgi:hypothetical protein
MIRVGLVLLVFGFFKKTTVNTGWGEIHNIGLMQIQTNLILLGAVIFIGGLILKSKKSDANQEEDIADSQDLQKINEPFKKVGNALVTARNFLNKKFNEIPTDHKMLRWTSGILSGLILWLVSGFLFERTWIRDFLGVLFLILFNFTIFMSFRRGDVYRVVLPNLVIILLAVLLMWFFPIFALEHRWIGDDWHFVAFFVSIWISPVIVSYLVIRRKKFDNKSRYLIGYICIFIPAAFIVSIGFWGLLKIFGG